MKPIDALIIPIVALLMPLVLVPTVLVLKHRFKRREWEHLERMKAMNSSRPLARPAGWVGSGGVAAIGAGVPAASVIGAFLTSLFWEPTALQDIPVPTVAWGCAVLISAGGLLTSLALAFLQARTLHRLESSAAAEREYAKPVFDPDTFDVVGSRG